MLLKNMSFNPNTVFEDILAGKLPAEFVYEDALVTAFMDIQPITDGHVLVIPNIKAATLEELKPEYGERMFLVAQKIALALKASTLASEGKISSWPTARQLVKPCITCIFTFSLGLREMVSVGNYQNAIIHPLR